MLPEERQAEIMAYLDQHSLAETAEWLKQDGFKVSPTALSYWRSDYLLRSAMKQVDADAQTFMDQLRSQNPELTQDKIFAMGQQFFNMQAIRMADDKMWARTQKLRIAEARTGLEERRIAVLEKKAAAFDQAKEVMEANLSPEENKRRLKEILK